MIGRLFIGQGELKDHFDEGSGVNLHPRRSTRYSISTNVRPCRPLFHIFFAERQNAPCDKNRYRRFRTTPAESNSVRGFSDNRGKGPNLKQEDNVDNSINHRQNILCDLGLQRKETPLEKQKLSV